MLVNSQGHVKLCDFGVSVQLLTSLTKTFIGTNAYMAVSPPFAICMKAGFVCNSVAYDLLFCIFFQPERILGGEYGIHSEVWSLGVSVLEVRVHCAVVVF